jgi:hypothetical protein
MADDELIALEHENWIAYLTGVVTCARRARVARTGGTVAILTGLPFDWFNQVLIERERATPAGVLAGVARARERGDTFVVRLRQGIDDRFIPILIQAGLAPARRRRRMRSDVGYASAPMSPATWLTPASPSGRSRQSRRAAGRSGAFAPRSGCDDLRAD